MSIFVRLDLCWCDYFSSSAVATSVVNIAAVLMPKGVDTKVFTDALTTLFSKDKNITDQQRTAATDLLNGTYGLDPQTIKSPTDIIGKKNNNGASTIGTVLGTVGKSVVTAYLGIPVAPASAK